METEENEDPEDLLEREQLKRSNRRIKKIALRSGWISVSLVVVGFLFFKLLVAIDSGYLPHSILKIMAIAFLACVILSASTFRPARRSSVAEASRLIGNRFDHRGRPILIQAMENEENEDPEDLLEREQLERSTRRMRAVAAWSGRISLYLLGVGILLFVILLSDFLPYISFSNQRFLSISFFACVVIGPLASMVDLCLVICLAARREKGLKGLIFLGLPGALGSLALVAGFIVAELI